MDVRAASTPSNCVWDDASTGMDVAVDVSDTVGVLVASSLTGNRRGLM